MKIYTKTGDRGETTLFTGNKVLKDDPYIEALGSVDECNSALGAALAFFSNTEEVNEIRQQLEIIQHALFDLGAALATPQTLATHHKKEKTYFDSDGTALLEQWIDRMEAQLPPLHTFILPGGHPAGSLLHVARSICRRAERRVLPLHKRGDVSEAVIIYLNRLSDYLFCVSRLINFLYKTPETHWKPHSSHSKS